MKIPKIPKIPEKWRPWAIYLIAAGILVPVVGGVFRIDDGATVTLSVAMGVAAGLLAVTGEERSRFIILSVGMGAVGFMVLDGLPLLSGVLFWLANAVKNVGVSMAVPTMAFEFYDIVAHKKAR